MSRLEGGDGPADRTTLASKVAVAEHGGGSPSDRAEEIETALHHVHLSKLAAAGVLQYDIDGEIVRLADGLSAGREVDSTDTLRTTF